jgi:DNA adenine methylase
MDYLTTAQFAEKWKISQRRVAIYCKEGRIEGAVMVGKMWMIPKGAEKPQDPRKVRKIGQVK